MKLADVPEAVQADLARARQGRRGTPDRTPAGGALWFGPADRNADEADACSICGELEIVEILHVDHCHRTGLLRGLLCRSCNLGEARSDAPRFEWWRLHAPRLVDRVVHGPEGLLNGFTHGELANTPIADLLADPRAQDIKGHQFYLWQLAGWKGLTRSAVDA